jgi:hypothetical protein
MRIRGHEIQVSIAYRLFRLTILFPPHDDVVVETFIELFVIFFTLAWLARFNYFTIKIFTLD